MSLLHCNDRSNGCDGVRRFDCVTTRAAVADLWRGLSSLTARRCNNLTVTVSGYRPKFEQWKMQAGDEYVVMPVTVMHATTQLQCLTDGRTDRRICDSQDRVA